MGRASPGACDDDPRRMAAETGDETGQGFCGRMGLLRDGRTVSEPIDWPAPGRAYTGFGEFNQRELLSQWCDLMEGALADGSGNGRVGGHAARVATLD